MVVKVKRFSELSTDELYSILELRVAVFVVEQECPYAEVDGLDREAVHVWLEEDGKIILMDYKTDACPASELPAKYGPQLQWYAKALRTTTEHPVGEMWLYSLREGRAIRVENLSPESQNNGAQCSDT